MEKQIQGENQKKDSPTANNETDEIGIEKV